MAEKIMIKDLLKIEDASQYKLHLAAREPTGEHPLDVYVESRDRWLGWNQWRGKRNDWTRDYIFSFMEFYPRRDSWLFGGVFKVRQRAKDGYKLDTVSGFEKYEGRVIVSFHRYQGMRGRAYYLENYLDELEVAQILREAYCGEAFCGYEKIDHDFNMLKAIFENEKPDWKTALANIKGVYLICDKSNGKKYVGSAYGEGGIWTRWACYIGTGHGWSDEITRLIDREGIEYARKNFKFSLLERMATTTPDEEIRERESHWKRVLLTREHGYNQN